MSRIRLPAPPKQRTLSRHSTFTHKQLMVLAGRLWRLAAEYRLRAIDDDVTADDLRMWWLDAGQIDLLALYLLADDKAMCRKILGGLDTYVREGCPLPLLRWTQS